MRARVEAQGRASVERSAVRVGNGDGGQGMGGGRTGYAGGRNTAPPTPPCLAGDALCRFLAFHADRGGDVVADDAFAGLAVAGDAEGDGAVEGRALEEGDAGA